MCEVLKLIIVYLYNNATLVNLNSLASSFAYITAAYVGIKGLSAWKSQLKGNQDYSLAKELMLSIYKYQEAMNNVRSPAIWASEYPDFSQDELKISRSMKRFKEVSHAYQKRWDRVSELKPKIFEQILEGQVLWGIEIRSLVQDLLKLENNVMFAIGRHLSAINPDTLSEDRVCDDKNWMYDTGDDESDIYRKPFKAKLKLVEDFLKLKLTL